MKVAELTGELLNYWAGKAAGLDVVFAEGMAQVLYYQKGDSKAYQRYEPSTDWGEAGPLLDKFKISLIHVDHSTYGHRLMASDWFEGPHWSAFIKNHHPLHYGYADQLPLPAVMRVLVHLTYGADVPDEVTDESK